MKKLLILLLAMLVIGIAKAQKIKAKTDTAKKQNTRLFETEKELKAYETLFKNPLANATKAYENKLDEKLLEIKKQNDRIESLGWGFGASSLIAFLMLVYQYCIGINKRVDKKLRMRIDHMIEKNDKQLQDAVLKAIESHSFDVFQLIKKNDQVTQNIRNANILVLSEEKEQDLFFQKFFEKKKSLNLNPLISRYLLMFQPTIIYLPNMT